MGLAPSRQTGRTQPTTPSPSTKENELDFDTERTYADVTTYDIDADAIVKVGAVQYWAVRENPEVGQEVSGITFVLDEGDLTITDEQLAALGYAKQ